MSEQSKPKSTPESSEAKSTETPSKSDTAKPSNSGKSEGGKSSRESVGGTSAVHYGFFSNVKTPQYRLGWDDIWSKKSEPKKKKPARAKKPVVISLAVDALPEEVQKSLADAARVKLKNSRINYDNRAKTGGVTWRIECEVKR